MASKRSINSVTNSSTSAVERNYYANGSRNYKLNYKIDLVSEFFYNPLIVQSNFEKRSIINYFIHLNIEMKLNSAWNRFSGCVFLQKKLLH